MAEPWPVVEAEVVIYVELSGYAKVLLPRWRTGDELPVVDIVGEVVSTLEDLLRNHVSASEDAASAPEPLAPWNASAPVTASRSA